MMDMFASDSDWESFSESGSREEQEEIHSIYGGQARSIFSSLEESIGKINDFLSFERGFMHGDMVCCVTDPSGQMGRVLNVDMFVDLEHVHGKIIKDVNSKMLLRMRSISVGDYVVQGPWLGVVAKVEDTVTVMFDDGGMYEVTAMDQKKFLPISPNLLEDPQYPFYPGQRVQVRHSIASKSARWFCGSWNENKDEGTVCSVNASLVYVDWLASAPIGCNMGLLALPAPPRLQESKNVTLLSCFSHANWQLGDWSILPIANCKGIMEQTLCNSFTGEIIKNFMKVERGSERRGLNSNFEEIFVIAKTKAKVDVVWQDGSSSLGLDPQSLLPVNVVNTHDFWPEQFVIERGTCDDPHVSCSQKWGVVRGVDAKERTVKVKWKKFAPERGNDFGGEWMEETVSAYELVEHPIYSYCYGDVVFRMFQNQNIDQADKDHVKSEIVKGVEAALEEKNYDRDQNEDPDKCYLSCIGIVIGFKDGLVNVRWANGLTTKVGPDEIFRIDKYLASTPIPMLSDQNVEELNQGIIECDKQSSTHKGKDLMNSNSVGEDCKKHPWESSSSFLPQSAIGYFTSIAASLFRSLGSTSPSTSMLSGHNYEYGNKSKTVQESELEICSLLKEEEPLLEDELRICETSLKQASKGIQENIDIQFSSDSKNSEQFRRFDMVGDCSDHHFLDGAGKKLASSQVKRGWLKKVQQEWSILENNLPETIYVRAYEERMDLLRAAIVGAPGTPYHDGIFFFDILLPPEYPHEPPLVHYLSGGLRVNPNLYESGKVCLSLLNTWTGTGTEVWNPGSSTILQVLLSLQALVLNDKPYFNEAGYEKQVGRAEGEKNSVSYNENAVLVTCKSMLFILRRPPKHFEAFVEQHFSRRSRHILLACKAYMEGAAIRYAFGNEQAEHEHLKGSSTGFKIMLSKLFPKLVEAFSEKGIDCSQFVAPEN